MTALSVALSGCASLEREDRIGELPQARLVMEWPLPLCLFACRLVVEQATVLLEEGATAADIAETMGNISEIENKIPAPVVPPVKIPP